MFIINNYFNYVNQINFFTPVATLSWAENYFAYGQKKAVLVSPLKKGDNLVYLEKNEMAWYIVAIKIISLIFLIILVIALIKKGVDHYFYRFIISTPIEAKGGVAAEAKAKDEEKPLEAPKPPGGDSTKPVKNEEVVHKINLGELSKTLSKEDEVEIKEEVNKSTPIEAKGGVAAEAKAKDEEKPLEASKPPGGSSTEPVKNEEVVHKINLGELSKTLSKEDEVEIKEEVNKLFDRLNGRIKLSLDRTKREQFRKEGFAFTKILDELPALKEKYKIDICHCGGLNINELPLTFSTHFNGITSEKCLEKKELNYFSIGSGELFQEMLLIYFMLHDLNAKGNFAGKQDPFTFRVYLSEYKKIQRETLLFFDAFMKKIGQEFHINVEATVIHDFSQTKDRESLMHKEIRSIPNPIDLVTCVDVIEDSPSCNWFRIADMLEVLKRDRNEEDLKIFFTENEEIFTLEDTRHRTARLHSNVHFNSLKKFNEILHQIPYKRV